MTCKNPWTKYKKLIDEMEDIKTGRKQSKQMKEARLKYQGKGYGGNEASL